MATGGRNVKQSEMGETRRTWELICASNRATAGGEIQGERYRPDSSENDTTVDLVWVHRAGKERGPKTKKRRKKKDTLLVETKKRGRPLTLKGGRKDTKTTSKEDITSCRKELKKTWIWQEQHGGGSTKE